jgi:hypothetical protein
MPQPEKFDWSYRVGASVFAALAGTILGLVIFACLYVAGWAVGERALVNTVGSGAISGALAGLLVPSCAMGCVEGVLHLLFGLFGTGSVPSEDGRSDPLGGSSERRAWLRWAFFFGVAVAALIRVALYL